MPELNLGKDRGILKFSWKELAAITALAGSMTYHVFETRAELASLKLSEKRCEERLAKLEQQQKTFLEQLKTDPICAGPPCHAPELSK